MAAAAITTAKKRTAQCIHAVLSHFLYFLQSVQGLCIDFSDHRKGSDHQKDPHRQTDKWKQRILSIWPDAQIFDRYTIEKNTRFDRERLEKYADRLPDGFTVIPISRDWYGHCLEEAWTRDFVSDFPSAEDFVRYGVGFLVLDPSGRPAAGASSYSVYRGGIEIEVDTNENYRRRGLALAVCARLILTCLEKGLYPSWDAANLASVSLAQKLGYTPGHHYEVFYLSQKDPQQTATGQVVFNGNR